MQIKTVIVGGGIAGMSCALRLMEAGQDFLLITDRLGGRIMYREEVKVNFGAYFVMANYAKAKKVVAAGSLIPPTDACFHNSETDRFPVLSLHTLRSLPEFVRFLLVLREFAGHYEPYKKRCLSIPQKAALEADPYLADLYQKPAAQFIQEKRLEQVTADYIAKFTYACTGVGPGDLTALDFLNVSTGLVVPIYNLEFDRQALTHKLGERLVIDTICRVEQRDGLYHLSGDSRSDYRAEEVVIATPAVITQQLLGLPEIRQACKLHVFHVIAQMKPIYTQYVLNLFPPTSEIMLTARQADGSYLIYSREKNTDLHQVYEDYELLATQDWDKAMYVHGSAYIEQQYGEHLYVAGDHNGLGLEPAAISGIYAANQIIQKMSGGK